MYIEAVPNRSSPPAILLRESYREGRKVKKHTLANLTHWPSDKVEGLRRVLRNDTLVSPDDAFDIVRSLPHGHVAAVVGTLRRLQLDKFIASRRSPQRDLVVAMIAARVLDPRSKLATARGLAEQTAVDTLGKVLSLESIDEDELYEAMDWLLPRQSKIEAALAGQHLEQGTLALYDATSTYFEGRTCPLGELGRPKADGKKGKPQIVIGLLCAPNGCPVGVEVFKGNTSDPKTVAPQIKKLRERFGINRVVFVGDRGMITQARIEQDLRPAEGVGWITALRAPAIKKLVKTGAFQLSLFDEQDLAEIRDNPDSPGERLVVCRNPLLAEERARKREDMLRATERELDKIVARTKRPRRPLAGKDQIGIAIGKVVNRYKMAKHFELEIGEDSFRYEQDLEGIQAEAQLDGIYVLRTSVPESELDAEATVRAYKGLSAVERAFRCLKTVDLKVRPIHHRLEDRVRAHVLLCMLAYYVEWHMREALAPLLFDDDDKLSAEAARSSIVAPAQRSASAWSKARTKRTKDGFPVHSFQTLLGDLATITSNTVRYRLDDAPTFGRTTIPTALQQRALDLLHVRVEM
jgi:transposase